MPLAPGCGERNTEHILKKPPVPLLILHHIGVVMKTLRRAGQQPSHCIPPAFFAQTVRHASLSRKQFGEPPGRQSLPRVSSSAPECIAPMRIDLLREGVRDANLLTSNFDVDAALSCKMRYESNYRASGAEGADDGDSQEQQWNIQAKA
jgi:hypothetical protein